MADRAPDVVGEIVGYRSWYVERRLGLELPVLVSINGGKGWNDAVHPPWPHRAWMIAECPSGEPGIPHEGRCDTGGRGCGIHAARDRSHLADIGYNALDGVLVMGEVALAGQVIPGSMGWRAERARPLRLWVPHDRWWFARPLSQAYGVPAGLTNPYKEA